MRAEKTLLLQEIKDKIDSSKAIVLATYNKMTPNLAAAFRSNIGKTGGSFAVIKKRLLMKAAEKAGFSLEKANLQGHIGVVFTDADPVQTTKYVYQFCKENEAVLNVIGGRFEGKVCSAKDVEYISQLPSQDEMRAQFLGLLEAPMSQTLATIEALLCSVMHCLDNKASVAEANSVGENSAEETSTEENSSL
jgi:large subunit ribosomal protein L10